MYGHDIAGLLRSRAKRLVGSRSLGRGEDLWQRYHKIQRMPPFIARYHRYYSSSDKERKGLKLSAVVRINLDCVE